MPAPAPRANPLLLGHHAAEATILDALRAGRMHHAWLITGPDGVGKATLAFRFARRLLAGLPADLSAVGDLALDPAHPTFRRVAAGSHADLLTVELGVNEKTGRQRSQIAVDDVRRIGGFMSLTPAEGGWRVVVVDGAEDLNQASANALLKVLEEPPARALLILCCAAPGRLLPTIRSRCRRLRLDPLDDAAMALLLAACLPELSEDERLRLITLAEGSPGRALRLADAEGLKIAALVDEVLAALPNLPAGRAYALADTLLRGKAGSPPSWTCCAPAWPPRCARRCAAGRTRSRRGSSRCARRTPGARSGRHCRGCRTRPNASRSTSARRWLPGWGCCAAEPAGRAPLGAERRVAIGAGRVGPI